MFDTRRLQFINIGEPGEGPVVYWMIRERRVQDNWALIFAAQEARRLGRQLIVVVNIATDFLEASWRHYDFLLRGLQETENNLYHLNIELVLKVGEAEKNIPEFLESVNCGLLISDFYPLKHVSSWQRKVGESINIPFIMVDGHNIVPCWHASDKLEFAAYTLRPKINELLDEFLTEFPEVKPLSPENVRGLAKNNWEGVKSRLAIDFTVNPVDLRPGEKSAKSALKEFIVNRLDNYALSRNDPVEDTVSRLSAYLHFGHISAQRVALEINKSGKAIDSIDAFLEELIIRKELSDNFCFFDPNYDNPEGFHSWAHKTIDEHREDPREYIYSLSDFEMAFTHDKLWNAAQNQLLKTGRIHGYMRMYWGKKILEWTDSVEDAQKIAIFLNDKYALDGCDPNGYTGIAWCIGGVHDRAWPERPVFGKIRYMNYNGCRRKFDVDAYCRKWNE